VPFAKASLGKSARARSDDLYASVLVCEAAAYSLMQRARRRIHRSYRIRCDLSLVVAARWLGPHRRFEPLIEK
jgi:hypothetical protein